MVPNATLGTVNSIIIEDFSENEESSNNANISISHKINDSVYPKENIEIISIKKGMI